MSEENDGQQAGSEQGQQDEFRPITSQEDFERALGKRLERERSKFADYDDLKAKAAKFDEAEAASKTELQKITEERDALARERDGLKLGQLRLDVGSAKGLTPAQARRLVGSTQEELEADADALLADFKPTKEKPNPKQLQSGSSGEPKTGEKGRAAAALRQLRQG